ncbi:DsbA family protein [Paracoccus fistulariae]|uniref:DsbA family protein n=1 Tax=Paracoccus fistulariae TaxID=658446 RepID=A0ABY7SKU4_9RHOB|nr:DsbA family protein [Paracoccus fistulariae]MDB6181471.1 DsbA family protein [Paracoccus fistulariae]WCR07509.1 DsbA family protein [Paracoccus fistulariae]
MKRLLATLLLGSTLAGPAFAFDISAMNEQEKEAFGQAVRDYLMANPEVLVESIGVLEARRQEQSVDNDRLLVAANQDAIFNDGHSWVGGNPYGDVTVVEFLDYRCGYCRRVNDQVQALVEDDPNVRLILKEYPILGQDSDSSARFAVAVKQIAGDEAYLKAHHALMALRGEASLEALGKIADEIGVDREEVINLMNTESVNAVLRANRQLGETMAIMGTPTFIIGDEMLRGVPQNGLEDYIQAARDKQDG